MDVSEFDEVTIRIAEDQPQYNTIPAHHGGGITTFRWTLSEEERREVMKTGVIWQQVMRGSAALQPVCLTVEKPLMVNNPSVAPNGG